MWWESLPSLAIVGACLAGVPIWVYSCNRLFFNNPYKRDVISYDDAHHFLRDTRISGTGNPYKQIGLESLEER